MFSLVAGIMPGNGPIEVYGGVAPVSVAFDCDAPRSHNIRPVSGFHARVSTSVRRAPAPQMTAMYLSALPIATSVTKGTIPTWRAPAITVRASPTIGNQARRSDQRPYFRNQFDALSSCRWETGNHRRSAKCRNTRPSTQLTTLPSVFPIVATVNNVMESDGRSNNRATKTISEEPGRIVAARKEATKMLRCAERLLIRSI